ncbi:hypothetical protein AB0L63_32085 [Nocardia sp. NPDC051990]|uniref:hypothetical protein n=1 Tax=Nocardia sp. NPDC051990 TaxID=3155285 RepID=UPI00342790F1
MTGESLRVDLTQLRRSFDVLLSHVRAAVAGDTVALDKDYFWSIPSDELYDPFNAPADLTIGSLADSWQHLSDLLADPDRAVGYHLVWLADVLRAIGHDI